MKIREEVESTLQEYGQDPEHVAFDGYKLVDLHMAFDAVKNQENWKYAVNATIPKGLFSHSLLESAVIFFTGSLPEVWDEGDSTRVEAAGYYMAVGS